MPLYDYRCPECGDFEARAGYAERFIFCACGKTAERRPYSGAVVASKATSMQWTEERSMEFLRSARRYDREGRAFIDTTKGAERGS